jgi:hypothetical protein
MLGMPTLRLVRWHTRGDSADLYSFPPDRSAPVVCAAAAAAAAQSWAPVVRPAGDRL